MADPDDADETRVPTDIGELFDVLVVDNNRVCSECFTRLARRERFPNEPGYRYAAILSFVDTVAPDDVKWDILDREYYERVQLRQRTEEAYPTGGEPTTGGTSACRNCGTISPHRTPAETRSREEALDDAHRLSDTLDEYGITHDEATLVDTVDSLKRDTDMAGRDHDVFEKAVAESVHAALSDYDTDG